MEFIKHLLRYILPILAVLIVSGEVAADTADKKILMVVSSNGELNGETAPGYEFDEFAKAYLVFKHNDVAVDVASPKGGAVEADQYDPNKPYNARVLADSAIMAKLDSTLSTANLDANQYDGIFVVGGKGAMFDLPDDVSLQQLIADIYQQEGTVAAVCHGPAALVDVRLNDGKYLVANKAVNGFTNEEEQLFGKKWMKDFEFMLEDKLVERGGLFQSSDIMLSHVAVDDRLITGQNPSSTVSVAFETVKSLGIDAKPMEQFKDDKTLALVARLLEGDHSAAQMLSDNQQQYHIALVGMYGYYYVNIASNEQDLENALMLMILAQKTIDNPRLDMQIAKTQLKIGDSLAARKTLSQILASKPDFGPALDMLETLSL